MVSGRQLREFNEDGLVRIGNRQINLAAVLAQYSEEGIEVVIDTNGQARSL